MAYNDVPLSSQRINQTQPLIRANFNNIQNAFSVDHVPIQDPSGDEGKHNKVTLPEQGGLPVTLINEAAIFSQLSSFTNTTELAWRRESNGSVIEFSGGLSAGNGWARLPSGILIKWGTQALAATPQLITFPVAATIPIFSSIFNVQVSFSTGNVNTRGYAAAFGIVVGSFSIAVTTNGGAVTDLTAHYFVIGT